MPVSRLHVKHMIYVALHGTWHITLPTYPQYYLLLSIVIHTYELPTVLQPICRTFQYVLMEDMYTYQMQFSSLCTPQNTILEWTSFSAVEVQERMNPSWEFHAHRRLYSVFCCSTLRQVFLLCAIDGVFRADGKHHVCPSVLCGILATLTRCSRVVGVACGSLARFALRSALFRCVECVWGILWSSVAWSWHRRAFLQIRCPWSECGCVENGLALDDIWCLCIFVPLFSSLLCVLPRCYECESERICRYL